METVKCYANVKKPSKKTSVQGHKMKSNDIDDPEHFPRVINLQDNSVPSIWLSKRLFVASLLFLGYFVYALCGQVMNIAIVDMTSNKTLFIHNQTTIETPEFNWDLEAIGKITNMYWIGYLFSFVGGYASQKLGGSTTVGLSIMLMATVILLHPVCARWSFYALLACQGFVASTAEAIAKWMPKKERTEFIFHIMNGVNIGTAAVFPFCGYLAYEWRWPMAFYATGILGFVWSILWLILVKNDPSKDKVISDNEREYILKETAQASRKINTQPYGEIFKSSSVWAVFSSKFTFNWGTIFVAGYLPLYMKDATQRNVNEIGNLSSIPSVAIIFAIPVAGMLLNWFQKHSNLSISQIHRIMLLVNFILAGVSFQMVTWTDNFIVAIVCFIIVRTTHAYNRVITEIVIVNMAPNHAGLLSGLTIIWYTIGAILAQLTVGLIVTTHKLKEWNTCFTISAGVSVASGIISMVFGSSDPQPWSTTTIPDENQNARNTKLLKRSCTADFKMKSTDTKAAEVASSLLNLQQDNRKPSIWFSRRFVVGIMLFFGFVIYSLQMLNVTIAIVGMTTEKQISKGNQTITIPPAFDWDSITVGIIMNMFWYGFLLSPVGGTLSQKFGGSVTLGTMVLSCGVITMLTPLGLSFHFYIFLVFRGLVGVFEGFFFASSSEIFAHWVPKKERPVFISFIMNGAYVGASIASPLGAYVVYHWGWQMIFYITGTISISWSVVWLLLIPNEPSTDRWISKKELEYISQETGGVSRQTVTYPYTDILKSAPFWALSIGKAAFAWGSTFIGLCYPMYISDRTKSDIKDVGILSSIPQIFDIVFVPIAGTLVGCWQNHSGLRPSQIHKIVIGAGFILCAILYTVITFVDSFLVANVCFITITVLISYNKTLLELITVYMAPNHSGLVSGLSLFLQTSGFIFTQTFIGFVVKDHEMEQWNFCFFTSTGVLLLSALIFVLYGSSEPQSWSVSEKQ